MGPAVSPLEHRVLLYLAQQQHVGREELAFITRASEAACQNAADSLVLAGLVRRVILPAKVCPDPDRPFWGILPYGERWILDEG